MTDQEHVEALFTKVHHMVIGVVLEDGTPWAVPVHIKHLENEIFEWDSNPNADHSKAISKNQSISISVFSIEDDIGFYAKATAEKLTDIPNENGQVRYRAVVSQSWLNESHTKRRLA